MSDNVFAVEMSRFSGTIFRSGIMIDVQIFRLQGEDRWCLEVIGDAGAITAFGRKFATDLDACVEFLRVLDTQGTRAFREPLSTLH